MTTSQRTWDIAKIRQILRLTGRATAGVSLRETLQAVVDGVVEVAGFEIAVINQMQSDGIMECIAVAGSASAREVLVGRLTPVSSYEAEFEIAEHWGSLRFVPHERLPADVVPEGWIPDIEEPDDPDAWHPQDALYVPLCSPMGTLFGVLSVDLPRDRRRPGPFQRDVLELYAAQAAIAIYQARLLDHVTASEQAFRLAFEAAGIGMTVISLTAGESGRYVRVNQAFCDLIGYQESDLLALTVSDITHPEDRPADRTNIEAVISKGKRLIRVEKRYLHAAGGSVWVAVTTSVVEDASGAPAYAISQVEDVSQRRKAQAELTHHALHDSLTGLANRRALYQHLHEVTGGGDPKPNGEVLFCDLDGFKAVNDEHGHLFGDQVLDIIAARLKSVVRGDDLVARLGGDEFVVVLHGDEAADVVARIAARVSEPMSVNGVGVQLTVSIGGAELLDGADPQDLIHRADLAMYEAKRRGGDAYVSADRDSTSA